MEVAGIFRTTIDGHLFGNPTGQLIKTTFSNLLLIFFTLIILYGITKVLVSYLESGVGGQWIKKIHNTTEDFL